MKKMLKKILFVSLLFSATVPATMQASFFSWATLRNGATEVGSKAVNWLNINSRNAFNFLKKHPIAVGGTVVVGGAATFALKKHPFLVGGAIVGTACAWKLSKAIKFYRNLWNKGLLNRELSKAAKEGNIAKVKQALESDADPNYQDSLGCSPVMLAADSGHDEIVELLLQNNATTIDLQDDFGWTALIYAVFKGKSESVKLLINSDADLNKNIDKFVNI